MANQRNRNQRSSSRNADSSRPRTAQQRSAQRQRSRRRNSRSSGFDLTRWLSSLRPKAEFRPDSQGGGFLKMLHITQAQRDLYLKWGLYIAVLVIACMIQDVIMSQVTLFGATTDLVVCVILLITVIEGVDTGSLFVLIASCLYYFSGSSPGPLCVAIMSVLGIGACLFRQMYWHRNQGSIVLCAGLALMLYEIGIFAVGIFSKLTRWDRLSTFVTTGLLSIAVMIPLYSLINVIGQIGGNTWKE